MESIVIGTAGHIDHGKTTLVKALTGHDTDTLEEEKRRGITINLGFAYFTLPNGKVAGIVDVPGHERFIKNMLAGASGIDIAMVVIAANEGVMPQTREHIDILRYMDIKESVVVLTKIGMVDDEFRELVLEDTKEYLQTTFLKDAPVFQVDSLSGKGIGDLISHLDAISSKAIAQRGSSDARMSVDRVFSVKGFGTVVTGTLSDGKIRIDEELMIYPGEIPTKVRTLQIHDKDVMEAHAGQRTAINLAGVTTEQVHRGSVVAKRDSVSVTNTMDVHFSLTESTGRTLKKMSECKMYLGAKELTVKVVPLDTRRVSAGQEAYGQILLEQPAVARRGDAFVLRTLTPVETIGGGKIIDPNVRRYKKIDESILESVRKKHTGTPKEALEAFIKEYPFQDAYRLEKMINTDGISGDLDKLLGEKTVIALDGLYVHKDNLSYARRRAGELLGKYHEEFPLRPGMPKAEFASRQDFAKGEKEFDLLLDWLETDKALDIKQGVVSLHGFTPSLSSRNGQLMREMEEQMEKAGYTLLTVPEITGGTNDKRQVLESLLQERYLLLQGQFVISRAGYEKAIGFARDLYTQHQAIRLSDFRDLLQTSRKYALLLLERFDKEKLTKRTGEDRILL